MNLRAIIKNREYRLPETVSSLNEQKLFVICEGSDGCKFVCPEYFRLRHAPKLEINAPVHTGKYIAGNLCLKEMKKM